MAAQQAIKHQFTKGSLQKRILIVDDDPDIVAALKDVIELEINGCAVSSAGNVEQAKLVAEEVKPDIVLLDIMIGRDNGLDLIPVLKEIKRDIDVVMMTAYRDNEYVIRAVRSGAKDYLYKPISPVNLIHVIDRLFQAQGLQKKIIVAERRFHQVFQQAYQWLFIVDDKGYVIDVNETALNYIDKDKASVLGQLLWCSPWWISTPIIKDNIQSGFNEALEGNVFHDEIEILQSGTDRKVIDVIMKPILTNDNDDNQIIVECVDITDRKNSEDEIRLLNSTLEKRVKERTMALEQSIQLLQQENERRKETETLFKNAKDYAEKASQAKSQFLSHMSHELRTPLNAILGFGQMLELDNSSLNELQRDNVQEILEAGRHLLVLINEVLDLEKIESGKMELVNEKVEVKEVLHQCIALTHKQAEEHHVQLVDAISDQGYIVQADFLRLKQVLLNLISNATKYNSEQGRVLIEGKIVGEQCLHISVTDNGKGLTEEEMGRLFTPFERLDVQNNVDGVGIGLVITKSLVELMDGTMGVESTPGEGSVFWIELNLEKDM